MNLGQKIQTARKHIGLSREALARSVGVTMQTIYLWETERSRPLRKYLKPLADALNLPLVELGEFSEGATISLEDLLEDVRRVVALRHGVTSDLVQLDISIAISANMS